MNVNLFAGTILFVSTVVLPGCCKKNSSVPPERFYAMSASLKNSSGVTGFRAVGPVYVTAVKETNICTISGIDTSGGAPVSAFMFRLRDFDGAHEYTYTYDSSSLSKVYFERYSPSFSQTAFAYASIKITTITGQNITGTFSGILTDGSEVREGTFTALGTGF
jgi:hypothetical protein